MERNSDILAKLRTMNIQGKPYATVPARIEAFWSMCPGGQIITECVVDTPERCMFRATIIDETGKTIATGHASEKPNTPVNKTSMLENCETSAIGRALGIAGIGSLESIASAEEVIGAITQRETPVRGSQKPSEPPKPSRTASDPLEGWRRRFAALRAEAKRKGIDDIEMGKTVAGILGRNSNQWDAHDFEAACSFFTQQIDQIPEED